MSPGTALHSGARGAEVPLRASFVPQILATAPVRAATPPPVSPVVASSPPPGCGTFLFVLSTARLSHRRTPLSRKVSSLPREWGKVPQFRARWSCGHHHSSLELPGPLPPLSCLPPL